MLNQVKKLFSELLECRPTDSAHCKSTSFYSWIRLHLV